MPITSTTTVAANRLANTAFAKTFLPRILRSVWPRISGLSKSSSIYEPFAFMGAPPLLKLFSGTIQSTPAQSFQMKVPNPVWKNYEAFRRNQFEFDQTRTIKTRAAWHGVRVAETWDYLLARTFINGAAAGSQNFYNPDDGVTYTMTFDNQPWFSASHTTSNAQGAPTFDNIVTGSLPTTIAGLFANDIAQNANFMQRDIANCIQQLSTWTDQNGALIYPDLDPEKQIVVLVPPCLSAIANLAFQSIGTIGGSNGSSSGGTTNIGKRMVKDVITFSLLGGCADITSAQLPGAAAGQITPAYPTQYYVLVDNDFVKPVYFQRFTPLQETIPHGYDIEAETDRILKAATAAGEPALKGLTPAMAELYATAEVNTNLDALGNNSQQLSAVDETFFFSSRTRGMIYPGPWFCTLKVDPQGVIS